MSTGINFEKDLNISYVDESLPKPSTKLIIKHWITSCLMYSFILFLLIYNPFLSSHFNDVLKKMYICALYTYILGSPLLYMIFRPKSIYNSHSIEIFNYLIRLAKNILNFKQFMLLDYKSMIEVFIPTYKEKQSLMLMFIKVFFGLLMTSSLQHNIYVLKENALKTVDIFLPLLNHFDINILEKIVIYYSDFFYKYALNILFSIDLAIFSIGYLTETAFLNNKIRTVETNIVGIIFCLACYTPFNNATGAFFGWNQNDNAIAYNDIYSPITWTLRLIGLFFVIIYVSASVALGTKASNLTNRGTVSKFPYNIVRHPAYISKNIFWLCTTIPIILVDFNSPKFNFYEWLLTTGLIAISYLFHATVYFFRAITEEQHLMKDPEYQEYVKKVKYRFIPFVF